MSAVDDFKHYVNVPDSHRLSVAWVKCLALDAIAELEALKARRCEGCKRHTRCRMEFENEYPGYSCNHWEAAE